MNLVMILMIFVLIQQHETVDVIWSQMGEGEILSGIRIKTSLSLI